MAVPDQAGLAKRLEEVAELRRLSFREWSELAGLSHGYVQGLVSGQRGKRLTVDPIRALARVAEVRWEWLLEGKGPREEQTEGPDAERLSPNLLEVLEHDRPAGRRGEWMPLTIEQLAQSWSYAGRDRTPEEWTRLGDMYEAANRMIDPPGRMVLAPGEPGKFMLVVEEPENMMHPANVGGRVEDEVEARRGSRRRGRLDRSAPTPSLQKKTS